MVKLLILSLVISIGVNADNRKCKLNDDVMLSIMKTEAHQKKGIGYRYLISFNNKKDVEIVKRSVLKNYLLDNRTLDCKDLNTCKRITKALWSIGIINTDLGALQINSYYHKYDAGDYFSLKESYYIACDYIEKLIDKHGKNWYSVSGYHSLTKEHNTKYQKSLKRNYEFIKKWKEDNKDS